MRLDLRALLLAIVAIALCARARGLDASAVQAGAAKLPKKELSQSTSSAGSLRARRATADGSIEVQTPSPSAGVGSTNDNHAAQAATQRFSKTAAALRTAMANPLPSTKPPSIPAASPTIPTAPLTIVRTAPPTVRTTSKLLPVRQAASQSVPTQRTTSALCAQAARAVRLTNTLQGKTTASRLRGTTTSSTSRNVQRTSKNQRRVKGGTARNGVPMKTIYVFGPESTGTRFMTRSLSKLLEPTSTWDGETPACKTHIDPEGGGYVNIQHLSLPWGGYCKDAINIVPEVDMCNVFQKIKYERLFVDIETLLKRMPDARAIVLSRDATYTMRSVLKHHCANRVMAQEEHQTALDLISKAVESPEVGNRVLRVEYESLGRLPELTWARIMEFADIQRPPNYTLPAFRSGNHRRRLLREARRAASEAAVGVDQDEQ